MREHEDASDIDDLSKPDWLVDCLQKKISYIMAFPWSFTSTTGPFILIPGYQSVVMLIPLFWEERKAAITYILKVSGMNRSEIEPARYNTETEALQLYHQGGKFIR